MARTAGIKLKVKTTLDRTISLPTPMVWEDGARFTLQKRTEAEWVLVRDQPEPAPA